jgi:hypothetical protein
LDVGLSEENPITSNKKKKLAPSKVSANNVYFRRRQRGVHKGDGKSRNSKLAPIAKWMKERLYFLSGRYIRERDIPSLAVNSFHGNVL